MMRKREKITLLVFGIFLLIYSVKIAFLGGGGDFKIYLGAAELLKTNQPIYNVWINTTGKDGLPYLYSPFFAFILIPFTVLPYKLIYLVWSFINIFILYRIYKIICGFLDIYRFNDKDVFIFIAVLIAFSTRFILYNFSMLQVTFLMLYCIIEGVYQLKKTNSFISAMLFALGISIKILPIVIIPYLIIRNKTKALITTLLFTCLFLLVPATYLGINKNFKLLSEWWNVVNPTKSEYGIDENLAGEGVHSISALIPTLLKNTDSVYGLKLKRNIANLDDNTIHIISNCFILFLIVLTLLFIQKPFFQNLKNDRKTFFEVSYICLIIPLIFPHQQKYAFIFILPAIAYITEYLLNLKANKVAPSIKIYTLLIISFLLLVVSTDGIIGKHLYHVAQHYKLITYGSLLLILALWNCRPKSTQNDLS